MKLQGRTVVVTGASQGIGEQIAEEFARRGARVLLVARSADRLATIAARLDGEWIAADLTDAATVDSLVDRCLDRLGHIDVWVNNAGIETSDAFAHLSPDEIRTLVRLNFEAPLLLTRRILPHLLARGSGHIVQMSSVAGAVPFPGMVAYAGSKAGLTHFTETLRVELKGTGVGLTVAAPGPVDTDMWDRLDTGRSWPTPALRRFRLLQYLPKVDPETVARDVVDAVALGKPYVRPSARLQPFHVLDNAPRRLARIAMTGVKMSPISIDADAGAGAGAAVVRSGRDWTPIWATDNPPSVDWPLYTRGNVGEVFPEVVLPLTWTLYGGAAERGWRSAFVKMGLLMPDDFDPSETMVILSVFGGYCYINASFVRLLGVRAPGGTVEAIDQQFFGESDAPPYQPSPGDKNLKSSLKLGRTVFRLLGTKSVPALEDDKQAVAAYLAAYPGDDASDADLIAYIETLEPLFERLFARHIDNTFSVALVSGALADLCTKAGRPDLLVAALGGIGDVESAAPSASMWDLARQAAATPTVAAQFDHGVSGLLDRLADEPDAQPWLASFGTFLEAFGSRGPNEWDLGSDPWAFRPELALAAIDRMRSADESHAPVTQARRLAEERATAVAELRALLKAPDRFQFDKALAATTVFSQARERSKTTVIAAIQGARLAHRELARRIAERGGPAERWQACLYTRSEFPAAVADPVPFSAVVDERAALHARLADRIPPFIVQGEVPRSTRGPCGPTAVLRPRSVRCSPASPGARASPGAEPGGPRCGRPARPRSRRRPGRPDHRPVVDAVVPLRRGGRGRRRGHDEPRRHRVARTRDPVRGLGGRSDPADPRRSVDRGERQHRPGHRDRTPRLIRGGPLRSDQPPQRSAVEQHRDRAWAADLSVGPRRRP
ncbi:MAG: SDR family NAD(P)-dependent oxidoreductase [Ilumatobacteraceae bacterium]